MSSASTVVSITRSGRVRSPFTAIFAFSVARGASGLPRSSVPNNSQSLLSSRSATVSGFRFFQPTVPLKDSVRSLFWRSDSCSSKASMDNALAFDDSARRTSL